MDEALQIHLFTNQIIVLPKIEANSMGSMDKTRR